MSGSQRRPGLVKDRLSELDKLLLVERVRQNDQGIKNTQWDQEQEGWDRQRIRLIYISGEPLQAH